MVAAQEFRLQAAVYATALLLVYAPIVVRGVRGVTFFSVPFFMA